MGHPLRVLGLAFGSPWARFDHLLRRLSVEGGHLTGAHLRLVVNDVQALASVSRAWGRGLRL